jgi:hypothetical protein
MNSHHNNDSWVDVRRGRVKTIATIRQENRSPGEIESHRERHILTKSLTKLIG